MMAADTLIAFAQTYVAIGIVLGVMISLSPRRMWRKAFSDAEFYPQQNWRSYIALLGAVWFVLVWPLLLSNATVKYFRRRWK